MKKSEMIKAIADGTPVAVGRQFGGEPLPVAPRKCAVVAVGKPRRVNSGARWDISGHIANDGIWVRPEEPRDEDKYSPPITGRTKRYGRDDVREESSGAAAGCILVGPRDVWGTWAEYEAARDRHLTERQRAEQDKAEAERRYADAAEGLAAFGVRALTETTWHGPRPSTRRLLVIPVDQAERLAEVLRDGQRAEAAARRLLNA